MLLFTLSDPHHFLKNNKKVTSKIKDICKNMCQLLKISKKLIFDINITNSLEIKRINHKYRKINKVTDVITFAFHDNKEISTCLLGEMFICYPFCEDYAKQINLLEKMKEEELKKRERRKLTNFVIVHGILHMLGFEHKTDRELNKMLQITETILDNCHIK